MNHDPDIESRLRQSLAEHARHAPAGDRLAEQVLASVTSGAPQVSPPRRRWSWTLPLVTAGAVAAVAGTVVGVVHATHSSAPRPVPPGQGTAGTTVATPNATDLPLPGPSGAPSGIPRSSAPPAASAGRILDLTFVGTDAFALTSGQLYRSTDSGRTWSLAAGAPLDAEHIRFATPQVGYAFGPDALYLTRNGGHSWTDQPGGAIALETLDDNVIRVSTTCLPGCPMTVQISAIGGSAWTTTKAIQPGMSPGVTLTRTGSAAYLAVYGHVAGGGDQATTALWVSTDDGATWTDRGEPCPQGSGPGSGENDTAFLSTAADGAAGVICRPRTGDTGWEFPMVSTSAGASFTPGNRQAFGNGSVQAFALASARIVLVSLADGTYRSTDGGQHFARLGANSGSDPGPLQWLGFASSTVAHGLSADGRTVWTTTDAGLTWTPARLP